IEAIPQLFQDYVRIVERHKKVGWVIDLNDFNPVSAPPTARKAFTDEFERQRAIIEPGTLFEARVITSALARGIVTAVDWVLSRSYPAKNFSDFDSAYAWAEKTLRTQRNRQTPLTG
ncbi:MAG: hypothetical protein AAFQ82_12580, partial [Myxococcota bacterium]